MNTSHQQVKQQWRQEVQKIRHPTAYCQACIGQKQYKDDPIITCGICESSVHKSHYAYELVGKSVNRNHLTHNLDDWRCQRCRYLIERRFGLQVKCEFCPFPRGIMKKVIFESSPNHRKEIWVHPQCTTWCYPLIWIQNAKRTHYFKQIPQTATTKFWFRVEDEPNKKCFLCSDNYGYKIKCTFYSCQKFYHITCGKKIGVIRDLESMRFEPNNDDYNPIYCPIYCEEHLEAYVLDFANRVKLYTQKKDAQKIAHFTKVHNCYKIQLKNLTTSAKRAKQQQEIRNQFGKQLMIGGFEESSMSLSMSQVKSNDINSSDSQSHSSTFLAFLQQSYDLKDLDGLLMKKREYSNQDKGVNRVRESKHEKKTTKKQNKNKVRSNESISEQVNERIQEESRKSMEIEQSIGGRLVIVTSHKIYEQLSGIVEQKELVLQQKYIQGAYNAKNMMGIAKNIFLAQNVSFIPHNEMTQRMQDRGVNSEMVEQVEQGQNSQKGEYEKVSFNLFTPNNLQSPSNQVFGGNGNKNGQVPQQMMVEESIEQSREDGEYKEIIQERSERQLSQGEFSQQIIVPSSQFKFVNQQQDINQQQQIVADICEQKVIQKGDEERIVSQGFEQKMEDEMMDQQDQIDSNPIDQYLKQTDQLQSQRDQYLKQTDQLQSQRDQYLKQTDQYLKQTDQYLKQTDQYLKQTDQLQSQRDGQKCIRQKSNSIRGQQDSNKQQNPQQFQHYTIPNEIIPEPTQLIPTGSMTINPDTDNIINVQQIKQQSFLSPSQPQFSNQSYNPNQ